MPEEKPIGVSLQPQRLHATLGRFSDEALAGIPITGLYPAGQAIL
jgi:hypothetical protein